MNLESACQDGSNPPQNPAHRLPVPQAERAPSRVPHPSEKNRQDLSASIPAEMPAETQPAALRDLLESFAERAERSLTQQLRCTTECRLASCERITFDDFLARHPQPTCFNILRSSAFAMRWILDISNALAYPMVDLLLGSPPTSPATLDRPLSEIERRLLNRVTQTLVDDLNSCWNELILLDLKLENPSPKNLQRFEVNGDYPVLEFQFEVLLQNSQPSGPIGTMSLGIPLDTFELLMTGMLQDYLHRAAHQGIPLGARARMLLAGKRVGLVVNLARSTIRADDLANLQVGDIVTTEQSVHQAFEVQVHSAPVFPPQASCPGDADAPFETNASATSCERPSSPYGNEPPVIGNLKAKPGAYRHRKAIEIVETLDASR